MAYWYPDTAYDTTNLGTDSLGFRGLGAGVLQWNSTTDIRNIGSTGSFCSSTVHYASFPVAYDLDAASQVFSKANSAGDFGISLRCLKD